MRPDLLVIGAGLAGLSAALRATQAGLRVRVIAKGLGTLHWSTGNLDLLGYLPGAPHPVRKPMEAIYTLPESHPYARLGPERIGHCLSWWQKALGAAGLAYRPATPARSNWLLPSPAGAVRPTYLATEAQAGGDLSQAEPMLIVGFQGMRDFYPHLIAENLTRQGYAARAATLPLAVITRRQDSNTLHLAQELERPGRVQELAAALRPLVRPGERVGLPAILGLERHQAIWQGLATALDAPVFEIPTLPPSVPGIRLHRALTRHLEAQGVQIQVGLTAIGFQADRGRILAVETESSARPWRHQAEGFLLATGGILGGGFNSDPQGRFWEVVFNLPLTVPQDRNAWFRPHFLAPEGHPVFRGGLAVDGCFRPVDGHGTPLYQNLWAAGNLLAHVDAIQERSVEGLAVITGMAAAEALLA